MTLSEIEKQINISFDDVRNNLQSHALQTAWVSGSVVEGNGNASSDVDIYVATFSLDNKLTNFIKEDEYYVDVYFSNSRRVDHEYWPIKKIEELASKLDNIPFVINTKSILDYLTELEVEFIHRISHGVPIINKDEFESIKLLFDFSKLSTYLIENKYIYLDDAFDDTVGMLENNDIKSAAFRARYTIESAFDLLLYSYNVTNDKEKHRIKCINRLLPYYPNIRPLYEKYWSLVTKVPDSDKDLVKYIKEALYFSEDIVNEVNLRYKNNYA